MHTKFRTSLLPVGLIVATLLGTGYYSVSGGGSDLGGEGGSHGSPMKEGPVAYLGGTPALPAGFRDWAMCELGDRVETRPGLLSAAKWGPAMLSGVSGGCSPCGSSGGGFSGNPDSAAFGLQLSPPHDIPAGDAGVLPPRPSDHAYVMAGTGEVVYTEVDFIVPGIGFDLVWYRTFRSAYEFEGWTGYGWCHCAELYLVQETSNSQNFKAYFGTGRTGDMYTWDNGDDVWISPDGYWNQLSEGGTRASNHVPSHYANQPYLLVTEKNGVVMEFDLAINSPKDVFVCTKISDPWGNEMKLRYNTTDHYKLEEIHDTEGRIVYLDYADGLLTDVLVDDTTTHADYGDVAIDYTYSGNTLTRVEKQNTRLADGGSVSRPFTDYSYIGSGSAIKNLDTVEDCDTVILDFSYASSGVDRCLGVVDADGETHTYSYTMTGSPTYTRYTDPSGQQRDFLQADVANGDYFIVQVKDYLEDETGSNITNPVSLLIDRNSECCLIDSLEYPDGSREEWLYDDNGNLEVYTRVSSGSETDLVKKWDYDTFANHCRLLSTSGWLRAESNPSSKVTYTYDGGGMLDKVTWPSVTDGQPSSQAIEWEYEFDAYGRLESVEDPNGNTVGYSYSGNNISYTYDPGGLGRVHTTNRDVMGNVTFTQNPLGTQQTFTVTPDGRVLKVASSNSRETKHEYDLRGRRLKTSLLLDGSTWAHTIFTVSNGGVVTLTEEDDGGIEAFSTYSIEEGESSRYTQSLDPDEFGTRTKWGYGSYGLPWKVYNVDDSGSTVTTLTETLERDTMGRITARILVTGETIAYVYDGFGRLTETHEQLPSSNIRKTIRTLKSWGVPEVVEIKKDSTSLAKTTYEYDQAIRLYRETRDDVESGSSGDDAVTSYERDAGGRVEKLTDARGNDWLSEWDASGRIASTIDGIGNEVSYTYNDTNRTRTITSAEYNTDTTGVTSYIVVETMDLSGRVTSVKDQGSASGNRTTSFEYDKASRLTKKTTPLGFETVYTYDALGRQISTTEDIDTVTSPAVRAVTEYSYSDANRMLSAEDANGRVTDWVYDSFGRVVQLRYDATGGSPAVYSYSYDSAELLDVITEPLGNSVTLNFENGRRLTEVLISKASSGLGGPDRLLYTYDDLDRVISGKTQQSSGGSYSDLTVVEREYDGLGFLEVEEQDGGFTLNYSNDKLGAVTGITYPSSGAIVGTEYEVDALGRPTLVKRQLASSMETMALVFYEGYREVRRDQSAFHDLLRKQSWTSFKEPLELGYFKDSTYPGSDPITGLLSTWDADSRMVVRERTHDEGAYQQGEVFRYDEMGRLTKMWYDVRNPNSFAVTDPSEGTNPYNHRKIYTLGPVFERDNTKYKLDGGNEVTSDYSNNSFYQYSSVAGISNSWDANGQQTERGNDDFAWTALGQLRQAAISGQTARDYTYDAFFRRVRTVVGSQTNRFLYHGWHMIGEYDSTGGYWLWQEVPWNSGERMLEHIARDTNNLDNDENTTEYLPYAVHEDFQSTLWGLSNTSAVVKERYTYRDTFGLSSTLNASGADIGEYATNVHSRKRLHGGVVESVSGLYDFRMRWSDPVSGHWLSRDPYGPTDSLNLYQSMAAAPLQVTDAFGLSVVGLGQRIDGVPEFTPPGEPNIRPPLYSKTDECWQQFAMTLVMSGMHYDADVDQVRADRSYRRGNDTARGAGLGFSAGASLGSSGGPLGAVIVGSIGAAFGAIGGFIGSIGADDYYDGVGMRKAYLNWLERVNNACYDLVKCLREAGDNAQADKMAENNCTFPQTP